MNSGLQVPRLLWLATIFLLTFGANRLPAQQIQVTGGVAVDWLVSAPENTPQNWRPQTGLILGGQQIVAGTRKTIEGSLPLMSARDSATGALAWEKVYDLGPGNYGAVVQLAPAPDGQTFYALLGAASAPWQSSLNISEARVLAISAATGSIVWQWGQGDIATGSLIPISLGVSAAGNRIAITCQRVPSANLALFALDLAGNSIWNLEYDENQNFSVGGGVLVGNTNFAVAQLGLNKYRVYANDLQQGALLWWREYAGGTVREVAASQASNSLAVCSTSLDLIALSSGDLQWSTQVSSASIPQLVFDSNGQRLFVSEHINYVNPNLPQFRTRALAVPTGAVLWSVQKQIPNQSSNPYESFRSLGLALAPDQQRLAMMAVGAADDPFYNETPLLWTHDADTGASPWLKQVVKAGESVTPVHVDWSLDSQSILWAAALETGPAGAADYVGLDYTVAQYASALSAATGSAVWAQSLNATGGGQEVGVQVLSNASGTRIYTLSHWPGAIAISALDGGSGSTLWRREEPGVFENPASRIALSEDGTRLYWIRSEREPEAFPIPALTRIECLDTSTGQGLWNLNPIGGYFADLALSPDGSQVYAAIRGNNGGPSFGVTVAVHALTGAALWTHFIDPANSVEGPKALASSADGTRLFVCGSLSKVALQFDKFDSYFLALDPHTGQELWQAVYTTDQVPQVPLSLSHSSITGRLAVVGYTNTLDAAAVLDDATGNLLWAKQYPCGTFLGTCTTTVSSARLVQGGSRLLITGINSYQGFDYGDEAIVILEDAATGSTIWWNKPNASVYNQIQDLTVSENTQTVFLTTTSSTAKLTKSPLLKQMSFPVPYAVGFTRELDLKTGAELWSASLGSLPEVVGSRGLALAEDAGRLFTLGDVYQPGDGRDLLVASYELPTLTAYELPTLFNNPSSVSLTYGGSQFLSLRPGQEFAQAIYVVLGSAAGTTPGIPLGNGTLPLNEDGYLFFTWTSPNKAPLLGTLGTFNSQGLGNAEIRVPAGTEPSLAGLTLNHAAIGVRFTGPIPSLDWISNPQELKLTP